MKLKESKCTHRNPTLRGRIWHLRLTLSIRIRIRSLTRTLYQNIHPLLLVLSLLRELKLVPRVGKVPALDQGSVRRGQVQLKTFSPRSCEACIKCNLVCIRNAKEKEKPTY